MTQYFDDPIQQEIWATVRALNDAWTKGSPDDLVHFFHRDMMAITPTDRHRREGASACVAGWKGFAEATRIHHWEELDPAIHVYSDAAVVAYDYDISFDMNGQTIHTQGRDMYFFIKENNRWWAVADQFSSFPS